MESFGSFMGSLIYRAREDGAELDGHNGAVGLIFEDGSIQGFLVRPDAIAKTVAWRAICECGWQGATVIDRGSGEADRLGRPFEDFPDLWAEWVAHTDPFLAALPPDPAVLEAKAAEREKWARAIEMAELHGVEFDPKFKRSLTHGHDPLPPA
jgi:hypothetical protein